MLDIHAMSYSAQIDFFDRLLWVAERVQDNDDYMNHHNMILEGYGTVLTHIAEDPMLGQLMNLRVSHDDLVRDGLYITDADEIMAPEDLSQFLFLEDSHDSYEDMDPCKRVFIRRIHTIRLILQMTSATLSDRSTLNDYLRIMVSHEYEIDKMVQASMLKDSGSIVITFDSQVEI